MLPKTITITLTEDEHALIEMIARENGLTSPADAIHVLLRDAMMIYDVLWDKKFAETQDKLDQMADEALAVYLAVSPQVQNLRLRRAKRTKGV